MLEHAIGGGVMDFNGFDKGVIGKGMPIDSTLKRIRETELIERALAELGTGATDNGKRNDCLRHRLWHDAITTKPPRGVDVFVCFSGVDKSGACSSCYINCSGVGRYLGADDEWEIDSVSAAAKFTVHGWKEIEQMPEEE